MVFNNSAIDYTIGGSGTINGSGPLTLNGTHTVTLNTANGFTGGTTINGGTLALGQFNSAGTGSIVVNNGATLEFSGSGPTNEFHVGGTNSTVGLVFGANTNVTYSGTLSGGGDIVVSALGSGSLINLNGSMSNFNGTIDFSNVPSGTHPASTTAAEISLSAVEASSSISATVASPSTTATARPSPWPGWSVSPMHLPPARRPARASPPTPSAAVPSIPSSTASSAAAPAQAPWSMSPKLAATPNFWTGRILTPVSPRSPAAPSRSTTAAPSPARASASAAAARWPSAQAVETSTTPRPSSRSPPAPRSTSAPSADILRHPISPSSAPAEPSTANSTTAPERSRRARARSPSAR